ARGAADATPRRGRRRPRGPRLRDRRRAGARPHSQRRERGARRLLAVRCGAAGDHDTEDLLRRSFPALEFREVRVVEDGWDSLVLELDAEWIVRFPRRAEVEGRIEREILLLPILAGALPIAVPS